MALEPDPRISPFANGAPTPTTGSPAPAPVDVAEDEADLRQYLLNLGLPLSLLDWAREQLIEGRSENEIILSLQERPEFKAAFPEIDAQRATGQYVMSPAEIVNYRRKAREFAQQAGLPTGFYDQNSDFTKLIVGGVSLDEFAQRVKTAQIAAYQVPADVREALSGVLGIGDFTALAFDAGTAVPVLERKISEAEAATAARRTGFGALSAAERGRVADAGLSLAQQQQAFGELAAGKELFGALDAGETVIGRGEQLGAAFAGDTAAQVTVENRRARRKAQFSGSAGYGAAEQGVRGVGTAQ